MPDPALRRAGQLILALGILALVVGIAGYNLTTPSTEGRAGSNAVLDVGVLMSLLGAIAWAFGGIRSTVAPDQVNAGLRRIGFLLIVVGVLGAIAGVIAGYLTQPDTSSVIGIAPISSTGFYVAIIGDVMVALSHRRWASRSQPTSAQR
jgi:uncharacterized protein YjeT (DUF2065 family)